MNKFAKIKLNGKEVGKVGLSFYDDIKALGLGSLEVYPQFRNKGYGTKAIKNIIEEYKNKYDFIYCFVDEDNIDAIRFYKRIGKVYDEDGANDNNQYLVELYRKDGYVIPE